MRIHWLSIMTLAAAALSPAASAQLFSTPVHYSAANPRAVAVGDMNNDGIPDIVTGGSAISVLLGAGDATFASSGNYPHGVAGPFGGATSATSVALHDFDGDGNLDVVATFPGAPFAALTTVAIMHGNGSGALGAPTYLTAGLGPVSVKIGDLNGNGLPDLAVANRFTPEQVSIFFNEGNGEFGAPLMLASGNYVTCMSIGDVTGNGALDLVINSQNDGRVYVFPNDGAGNFGQPQFYLDGGLSLYGALHDVNGNGLLDFVSTNGLNSTISVLLNDGQGGFAFPLIFPNNDPQITQSGFPQGIAVADFDLDGAPDLAVAEAVQLVNGVVVHLGHGDGAFALEQTILGIGEGMRDIIAEDLNGNGVPDLIVTYNTAIVVLLNQTTPPPPSPDLNGDGSVGSADLAILLGAWGPCPAAPAACPADLDGDGAVGSADLAILLSSWGFQF